MSDNIDPLPQEDAPYTFRIAQTADARDIAGLELFSAFFENRLYPLNYSMDEFTKVWEERLQSREFFVILAFGGSKLKGFSAFRCPLKKGEIAAFYVSPMYFRQGIGRALMELSEKMVKQKGGKAITLKVEPLNNGAKAFYESLSFIEQGVKSSHLIVYKKELH